jgi:3-dehydroshikimate dehydratase
VIRGGLVSVTFRALQPEEIIDLVKKAGLEGIEWGGDIHVPHGDVKKAEQVYEMTAKAGLSVSSYGSYFRYGQDSLDAFPGIVAAASALHTDLIRVWAGFMGSEESTEENWNQVVEQSRQTARMAAPFGINLAYEFHQNTLADTAKATKALIEAVGEPNVKSFWQPSLKISMKESAGELKEVLPHLTNIHAYYLKRGRQPLAGAFDQWKDYLKLVASTGRDHWVLLEFVRDDSPEAFMEDARTLKELIEAVQP